MERLNPTERGILKSRFGLNDGRRTTLKEAGLEYGLSREETEQAEYRALKKLRHPDVMQSLDESILVRGWSELNK